MRALTIIITQKKKNAPMLGGTGAGTETVIGNEYVHQFDGFLQAV